MIVCVCRKVSDRQIRQAAAEGAATLDDLKRELGVSTQCGRCAECACRVLADAREALACHAVATEAPVAVLRRAA